MAKITDLLDDALNSPDYDKRISFLLAGLLSADANDTVEKEATSMGYIKEIYKYCCDYTGDKEEYVKRTVKRLKNYVD